MCRILCVQGDDFGTAGEAPELDTDAGIGQIELVFMKRLHNAFGSAANGKDLLQLGGGPDPLGISGEDGLDGGDDRGWGRR